MLETGSSALTLAGLVMGIGVSRKWLLLSLAVQAFFMQHALQGWCPPLPVFRRLGVRTQPEIDERDALKAPCAATTWRPNPRGDDRRQDAGAGPAA